MLTYKNIELSDRILFNSFADRMDCDLNDYHFGIQYLWKNAYFPRFAVLGDTVILAGGKEHGYIQVPLGDKDFVSAVNELIAVNPELRLYVPGTMLKERLEVEFPGKFRFIHREDMDEYIYNRSDLASYAGKKYQQKRNHINRFEREYGKIVHEPVSKNDIDEIRLFQHEWYLENHDYHPDDIAAENDAIELCFEHINELEMFGIAVRVEDKLCGFAIGERIGKNTVVEHFEKARRDIDGCYSVITREFARSLPEDILYINREEDMGLDGLRQSKRSLHPIRMEEKFIAELI